MPLILHHAFQTWNNVIESWLYLVKAIRSKGSIGQFGAFLTAALAVVRVEYRRFISGTTDTNAPATRARSIIGIGDIRKDYKNGKMSIVCVDYHKIYS